MAWDKLLETGIPQIDMQHKELFRQVDSLLDIKNQNRFQETLSFLERYVVRHFGDEQRMQAESKYPKAAAHKTLHDNFVRTFGGLKEKFAREGHTATNNIELHKTTMSWLKDHILVQDKDFAEHYKTHTPGR